MTFTFSEAPIGFTLDDITTAGGAVTGLTATSNPLVYTATFTATDGTAGSVSVNADSYTDAALNIGVSGSDTATVDRANPTVTVDIVGDELNDTDAASDVTFTFSEAPVGFSLSDITVAGGTISGLAATSDPLVYTATFTATDGFTGTGSMSVTAGSYTDAALNAGGSGSDIVAIDRANGGLVVDIVQDALNDSTPSSTVTFTFSATPTGFDASDITAVGGTVTGLAVTANPLVYQATFTAADGFAGAGSVSVAAGSYTTGLGNAGEAGSDLVDIDRVNPTVSVDIIDPTLSDADSSSSVTFTFSKAPLGFDLDDITAVGGTVSGLVATSDPLVYTATFTATDGFAGTGSVSVAAGSYTDEALNTGVSGSDTVAIDLSNPTVTVDIAAGTLSNSQASSTVTFSFSEAPAGFVASDITAVGGTVSGLAVTANPLVYTATFTATDGFTGTGSVSVAAGSYADAVLNVGSAGSDTVTIDRTTPAVAVDIANSSAERRQQQTSTVTFTFSEAPVGFALGDITAVGGTVSGLVATCRSAGLHGDVQRPPTASPAPARYRWRRAATPTRRSMPAARAPTRWRSTAPNPTVTVDIAGSSLSDGQASSTVSFTFSEAPAGFDGERHRGGRRHGERAGGDGQSAGLHGDLHGDRRLCRHRLGVGGGGQLHRYGTQRRRCGLRYGGDRPDEPDGDGRHRRQHA